jgi:hypothetical protein
MRQSRQIGMVGAVLLGVVLWGAPATGQTLEEDIPCHKEIRTYCADVQPGGGRILQCLKQHESALSMLCVHRLNALQETFSGTLSACREDWTAHCYHPRAATDRQGVLQCLQGTQAKVSVGCQKALQAAGGSQGQRPRGTVP